MKLPDNFLPPNGDKPATQTLHLMFDIDWTRLAASEGRKYKKKYKFEQISQQSPFIYQILDNSSAETRKFCGKGQIPRLDSKFRGRWKTVGPIDDDDDDYGEIKDHFYGEIFTKSQTNYM